MYAITETKNNLTSLVKFVDTKDEFLTYVTKTINNEHTLISNMSLDEFPRRRGPPCTWRFSMTPASGRCGRSHSIMP